MEADTAHAAIWGYLSVRYASELNDEDVLEL
jgi:hypothetical protein